MRYCKRCEAKYFTSNFEKCPACGGELAEGHDIYPSKVRGGLKEIRLHHAKGLLIIIILVIVVSLASRFPYSPTGAVTAGCVEIEEQYLAEIPYETDSVYLYYPRYNVLSSALEHQWNSQLGFYYNYTVVLQNMDTEDYTYTVQYLADTSKHGQLASLAKKLVEKGKSESFSAYFDTELEEQVDGKFIVYPDPVQKIGKIVRLENRSLSRKITKCY